MNAATDSSVVAAAPVAACIAERGDSGYKPRGYKDAEIDSLLKKG